MRAQPTQGLINHIALAIDASTSMKHLRDQVITVADAEIAYLAERSKQLDQETRVTVYTFGYAHDIHCVFYDKDVLRLPSLRGHYEPHGMTALVDATMQSQLDLEKTAQLYGDHAFLTYVLTDGQENDSRKHSTANLQMRLTRPLENWTVACLVPDQRAVFEAKKFGFPADNIAVWDATSERGVREAGSVVRTATATFMDNRARGVRGSKTLFAGGADQVNRENIRASQGFTPLDKNTYSLVPVLGGDNLEIRPFVVHVTGQPYRPGSAYYELTKPEKIQPQKVIMVRNRRSGRVYTGPDARALLSLPDHEVRVKPDYNPEFQIFVQSTSVNRKLVAGTKLLVLAA